MKAALLVISFSVFLIGCSFDYEEGKIAEDLSETVPETVLIDFVQVRTVEGKPDYRVYGSRAEAFAQKKETVLTDVIFQDFNTEGEIETEGVADSIIFFTDTENAEMDGNLQFYNAEEEVEIRSGYLFWNDSEDTLTSRETERVTLIKENGTVISGTGFIARGNEKTVDFAGGAAGTWVEEEEEANAEAPSDE